jgi:hypothetical protein
MLVHQQRYGIMEPDEADPQSEDVLTKLRTIAKEAETERIDASVQIEKHNQWSLSDVMVMISVCSTVFFPLLA